MKLLGCFAAQLRMKATIGVALFAASAALAQTSQTPAVSGPQPGSITIRSNLVVVPALVRDHSNQLVYSLKADDFLLTDNGVPQKLQLEEDTGDQPLALVLCVETGGAGAKHLAEYHSLDNLLGAMVGGVEHQVAVVGFDSTPTVLHGFTPNLDFITHSLNELDPGDQGVAILDGLAASVALLRRQPPQYRRAILLLSETIDQGSHIQLADALRDVADTNTVIYSVAFSSVKHDLSKEATRFGWKFLPPLTPGPKAGCFSRDLGTDANGDPIKPDESRAAQDLNCVEEILPPVRLARLAEIGARDALRQNVPEAVAKLTGGESFEFKDVKTLQRDLLTISNHVPNRYVLSFHPLQPVPGFHTIALRVRHDPQFSVEARNGYWVEDQNAPAP